MIVNVNITPEDFDILTSNERNVSLGKDEEVPYFFPEPEKVPTGEGSLLYFRDRVSYMLIRSYLGDRGYRVVEISLWSYNNTYILWVNKTLEDLRAAAHRPESKKFVPFMA